MGADRVALDLRPAGGPETSPQGPAPGLNIGISGIPRSAAAVSTLSAIKRCRELGIRLLEMSWVHKVTIGPGTAERVRAAAVAADVHLTAHGPYYINLNSRDPAIVTASQGRIVAAGRAATWCGATDVVLHLAFNHGEPGLAVLGRVTERLVEARQQLDAEGFAGVTLRPELMGRASQFGDLEDTLAVCTAAPGLAPCIDIAHLHARTGAWNTPAEFDDLWACVQDALGPRAIQAAHIHMSGIAYGPLGEIKHLALEESDLNYTAFLEACADAGVRGTVAVESPGREDDTLLVQRIWHNVTGGSAWQEEIQ